MGDIERDSTWARTAYNAYWGEHGITPSETQWAKDAGEWPSWMAVVAAILDGPPNASLLAERDRLEATAADLRSVNDALRAQLAEARAEVESLRGAEKAADKHVQTLEAQLADVRTFANFEAEKAKDYARQLREAQHRVEWVTHPDGRRTLVRHSIVVEELAEVGALDVNIPHSVSYGYAVDRISGTGQHSDPLHGQEQALSAAQRIVETLTGVRR
jgi:hypothetical protein